jgi:hypothetical protein
MLVTFSCPAYADITMFGDVAVRLLRLMGHSGTVPGALLAEDVGAALQRLEAGIATWEEEVPSQAAEEDEPRVSLRTRALPLIEVLRAADKEKVDVMWVENT